MFSTHAQGLGLVLGVIPSSPALGSDPKELVAAVEPKVLSWFKDLHQHPELGLQEVRTSGIVASHLRSLGVDTRIGVGKTGVVGILRGAKPGPVVALRADMDALPITEMTGLA